MLVPLSWLRDFAPFDDPAALAETFDDLGMVVEGVRRVGEGFDGVVVARVLDIRPIEGLDRVRLVTVDQGGGESVEVACGAWNFEVGQRVPLATVGTTLPNGMTIGRRKLRGVVSNGMLCSPDELGMPGGHAGLLILDGMTDAEPGAPLREALGVEPDVVYDLAIETNRPDAMSVAGIARDAAARLRMPFAIPALPVHAGGPRTADFASIDVQSSDLCPRFTARLLTGVGAGPAPRWVQRRLTLAGMRPINAIVDASNYVMLDLGQPSHPYDLDRLPGAGLLVRRARPGETVTTLDGVDRRVGDGDDCVICDAEGTAVGIGGIMGGASSEIGAGTTRVLLEAAYFRPMAIAWTSKRLGLRTEASARFERGCDPEGIERAVDRFCALLGAVDAAPDLLDARFISPEREAIRVRVDRVNAVLGTRLGASDVTGLLAPIGFRAVPASGGDVGGSVLDVIPPTFRPDATGEIDVIEEVGRHHGYSNITRTVPRTTQVGGLSPYQRHRRQLKEILAGAGVSEALASPLVGPGDHERVGVEGPFIEAVDPLAREESVLRVSLLPTLLRAVAYNTAHRNRDVALFEVGRVFPAGDPAAELPDEREVAGVALAGGEGAVWARRVLDVVVAGLTLDRVEIVAGGAPGLHPTRTARVLVDGVPAGWVGEVDPAVLARLDIPGRVGWIEADLARLLPAERRYRAARPVSKLPSTDIDLAFAVDDAVAAATVGDALRSAAGDLLVDLRLFDVYRGPGVPEGSRSVAFRLRFQAPDRTLTDEEVAAVRARCIAAVESSLPATLRG